jgi:hypothetical protein
MGLTNPQSASHIAAAGGTFEPQRGNNWSIEINLGKDKDPIIMSLMSLPLPAESNEEIEIQYQNEKRYVAGQATIDAVSLVVRDYVDADTRAAIMRWRAKVYDPASGKVGLAKDYKKNADIIMTAPDGSSERVCKLYGVWPQMVNSGNLDMSSAEPVTIEVTLRVDKVKWELPQAYGTM